MKRRGFLTGLTGILAAGAAPAIIHNAMKIYVPKKDVEMVVYDLVGKPRFSQLGRGLTTPIFHVDESPIQGSFNRYGPTQEGGQATKWLYREDDTFGEVFFPTRVITPADVFPPSRRYT